MTTLCTEHIRFQNASKPIRLHVVMSIFTFDFQEVINSFMAGEISFQDMNSVYKTCLKTEIDLNNYKHFLLKCRALSIFVRLHAGFIPC